jgi:hypothetical protein
MLALPLLFLATQSLPVPHSLAHPPSFQPPAFSRVSFRSFRCAAALAPLTFAGLLSPAVSLSASDSFSGRLFTARQATLSAAIVDCRFEHCASEAAGGALSASGALTVRSSVFLACRAETGGAVACADAALLALTAFESCAAAHAGALDARAADSAALGLDGCQFTNSSAGLFGTFYKCARGATAGFATNFTDSRSRGCVGSCELKWTGLNLQYAAFVRSRAASHNGAVCARHCARIAVTNVLFLNCSHSSNENEAGACFLIYENPGDSGMADSQFVDCDPDGSYLMTVTSGSNFIIVECWFSGTRERELNADFFVLDACKFEQKEFPPIRFGDPVKRTRCVQRGYQNGALVVGASAVMAAFGAVAVTAMVTGIHRRFCEAKVPKAFQ